MYTYIHIYIYTYILSNTCDDDDDGDDDGDDDDDDRDGGDDGNGGDDDKDEFPFNADPLANKSNAVTAYHRHAWSNWPRPCTRLASTAVLKRSQ